MGNKIRVGIIGIGFMGSTHFRIHKELGKSEIVAIADVDERKLQGDWSNIIGNIGDYDNSIPVNMDGIKCYSDPMDLINDPDIDMVDICTPTYLHKKYAIAAINNSKHVLCEKPLGRTHQEAIEITKAAEESNTLFMNGLCVRHWPEYRHAWELYRSGQLGKVKSATFKRISPSIHGNAWEDWFMKDKLSGGALLDLHLHDTDIIRYFFGKPHKVHSFGLEGFRSDKGIDHVFTYYDFENEALIMSEGGWAPAKNIPFEMSFQIVCEFGTIRLSSNEYAIYYEDGRVENPNVASDLLTTGWHVEINYFLDCIKTNTSPDKYLTKDHMRDSMAMIEAELKSIKEKRVMEVEYAE